jgi:polar amino acid transport system substrate-binding protein
MRHFWMAVVLVAVLAAPVASAEPLIPNLWDAKERIAKPDMSGLQRLRFLTTVDFPPFNFLDRSGRLTGFHVDLARSICAELEILDRCQIQALPWNELEGALKAGQGEAIIAGIAITPESRRKYAFSRSYLRLPARFVMQQGSAVSEPLYPKLAGKRVGVMAGSAHERLLRAYFDTALPITYTRPEWLFADLLEGKLDAIFGDGVRLAFWLSGQDSADCCRFAGGAYLAPEFLGPGLAIATAPDKADLAEAFNYALREIYTNGKFAELYLRYFPVGFF